MFEMSLIISAGYFFFAYEDRNALIVLFFCSICTGGRGDQLVVVLIGGVIMEIFAISILLDSPQYDISVRNK